MRSYNGRKLQQGVKKNHKFSYLFLTSLAKLKRILFPLLNTYFFFFVSDYCVPSDYSVKKELMITNYYVIRWKRND